MKRKRYFLFLFIPLLVAVLAGVVMLLWNAIVPEVFGWERLSYLQALGLLILSRILFGGFQFGPRRGGYRPHLREKWMHMTEEERQKFKEAWRNRFSN
jgi:Ca2+/H+ antiporter, TMEM165/GDT1 family